MIEEEPFSREPAPENHEQEELEIVADPSTNTSQPNWRRWIAAGGCAVLLCAAVFVGALIFAGPQIIQQFIPKKILTAKEVLRTQVQRNTMGDPRAPVHIIEYGDFQCPYCVKFWEEAEPRLIEEYVNTGKVYFEYRTYAFLGPESFSAAEGAYCAGDQDKFWEYRDTLFTNWTGENVGDFTDAKLVKYAGVLNLDVSQFKSCLNGKQHKNTVDLDMRSAKEDGVQSTPTLFINGMRVEGAQPFHALKEMIEQILNESVETQDL